MRKADDCHLFAFIYAALSLLLSVFQAYSQTCPINSLFLLYHKKSLLKYLPLANHVGVRIVIGAAPPPAPSSTTVITGAHRRQNLLWQYFVCVIAFIIFPLLVIIFNIFLSSREFIRWLLFLFLLCFAPLLTPSIVDTIIFSCERTLVMKRKKALFLKKSLFYFPCSTLNLVSWILYLRPHVRDINLIYHFITSTLVTCMLAITIWILKILILKQLACRFHDNDFFDKMKHFIDQEYVLQTLLIGTTMKLYIICDALHKPVTVDNLFALVVNKFTKDGPRDITEADLLRLMNKPNVSEVLRLFEAEETKIISQTSLRNWIVKVCEERKTLVDLLSDTSMAIKDMENIVFINLMVLLPAIWIFLMRFATTKFLMFVLASWLGVFLPTSKSISEGIIFVFIMRWFDTGDYCIIDNQKMVVKDIGIFSTLFCKDNNDSVSFSNSGLMTKSIQNLSRSSEVCETLEAYVTTTISNQKMKDIEINIDEFLKSKPESWSEGHSLLVKEVGEKGEKYILKVTHAKNFENYEVNNCQRSELILALKRILKELDIEFLSIQ